MSDEWTVEFFMSARIDDKTPYGPFVYLDEALKRKSPQRFFLTGVFAGARHEISGVSASVMVDRPVTFKGHPIVAIASEKVRHTVAERKLFLDNIITMLELMEAQRDVDRN